MKSKVKIEYKLGNRTVSRSQWERGLERQVTDMASNAIAQSARRVRCPVHGSTPTSVTRTHDGIRVQGCCDALTQAVLASLR